MFGTGVCVCAVLSSDGAFTEEVIRALKATGTQCGAIRVDSPRTLSAAAHASLVVVDLAHPPSIRVSEARRFTATSEAVLVAPDNGIVPARWLPVLDCPNAHRATLQMDEEDPYTALRSFLQGWASGVQPPDLALMVTNADSRLGDLPSEVRLILEDPWGIRRPRDLAAAAGDTMQGLLARCRTVGFRRIEHFITMVRVIAIEQLCQDGMPRCQACLLVGVADRANFRRQVQRAERSA